MALPNRQTDRTTRTRLREHEHSVSHCITVGSCRMRLLSSRLPSCCRPAFLLHIFPSADAVTTRPCGPLSHRATDPRMKIGGCVQLGPPRVRSAKRPRRPDPLCFPKPSDDNVCKRAMPSSTLHVRQQNVSAGLPIVHLADALESPIFSACSDDVFLFPLDPLPFPVASIAPASCTLACALTFLYLHQVLDAHTSERRLRRLPRSPPAIAGPADGAFVNNNTSPQPL